MICIEMLSQTHIEFIEDIVLNTIESKKKYLIIHYNTMLKHLTYLGSISFFLMVRGGMKYLNKHYRYTQIET